MPTQHTDIYNPTAPAIAYAGPGKTWTIANGVLVGSGNTAAGLQQLQRQHARQ